MEPKTSRTPKMNSGEQLRVDSLIENLLERISRTRKALRSANTLDELHAIEQRTLEIESSPLLRRKTMHKDAFPNG